MTITLSYYARETYTDPKRVETTWTRLAEVLAQPRRSSCTVATCLASRCPHKRGRAWSPGVLLPGKRRSSVSIDVVTALVLDLDHVPEDELAALMSRLAGYQRIVHSSHSDRPGDRCMRVVLAVSRPIVAKDWPRVWAATIDELAARGSADGKARDPSRLYFLPSRPADADYAYVAGDGDPLDVDALLANAPAPRPYTSAHVTRAPSRAMAPSTDVYAALAQLDQASVLIAISGSELVRGELIEIAVANRRGDRTIVINGRQTSGRVDQHGHIWHTPSRPGARDGGPLASTWCRYYGWSDREIRAQLVGLVSDLEPWRTPARPTTRRDEPPPRYTRGAR